MSINSYFTNFPVINYDINNDGNLQQVLDITHSARLQATLINNSYIYYEWQINADDSPEDIAFKYYGDPGYFWLVLFANQMYNRYTDWILSQQELEDYIRAIYGSLHQAQFTVHHYEDLHGNIIDLTTYNGFGGNKIDCYTWYVKQNEAKRTIKLIDKIYLTQINTELLKILQPDS